MAGVLDDAGVPHFVDGGVLADEFATTQRMMNLQSVAVRVPETHLEEAKRALEEAREAGKQLEADPEVEPAEAGEHPERGVVTPGLPGRPLQMATLLAWILAPLFFVLWMQARSSGARAEGTGQGDAIYRYEREGDRILSIRRDTGAIQFVQTLDADGRVVETETRDLDGQRISRSVDADGDGIAEFYETLARDGGVTSTASDTNQDGRLDVLVEHWGDGRSTRYVDQDRDGLWERLELRVDGGVVREQRFDPERGWVDVSR